MSMEQEYSNYLKRLHENYYSNSNMADYRRKKHKDKEIILQKLIGEGSASQLIEFEVDFPQLYPCYELKEVSAKVSDLHLHACSNKVIINGVLSCSVDYKVYEGKANLRCGGIQQNAVWGTVKNISADIPFSTFVEIVGTKPGDNVEVVFAGTEDCSDSSRLNKSFCIPGNEIIVFRKLKHSFLIKISLKILRQMTFAIKSRDIWE